jgi:hypothetical protein
MSTFRVWLRRITRPKSYGWPNREFPSRPGDTRFPGIQTWFTSS